MEYYQNRRCVTVEDLTRADDGEAVMTVPNYRYYSNRSYFRYLRRGKGLGCYALIEFESLPPRYKARFIDKYGDPKEVLKDKPITEELFTDDKARRFYQTWRLPSGKSMTDDQVDEYTNNASVANQLLSIINDHRSARRAHGPTASDFWGSVLATSENFRKYPGHTLPAGKAQLQNKLNAYRKEGYVALLSGKLGNANTIKITDEMGDQIIALKRCWVPVYSDGDIFEEINRLAPERGWKPLRSVKTLVQWLHRADIKPRWYDAVMGEGEANKLYARKNRTVMPKVRDAIWYSDGTKLNMYYKATNDKGELVVRTAMVYEVMDAYSEVFLGYHISDTENFDAQYRAFRMAIETHRCRPYEIVNDNQGGHLKGDSQGFFKRITGHIARHTTPHNAPGKSIESAFGRFQRQHLRKYYGFTGMNITATSPESRANMERVKANVDKLYTLDELKDAYAVYRHEWNTATHPTGKGSRMDLYLNSKNAGARTVSDLDLLELFRLKTAKPSTFTPSGITIEINKERYTFEVFDAEGLPDMEFRRNHTYGKFIVEYDPFDMTFVRLFSKDRNGATRYVADAYPYATFHRAKQEQTSEEAALIRTLARINDEARIRRVVEGAALENKYGVAPEQFGLNRPKVLGMNDKRSERLMAAMTARQDDAPQSEPRDEIVEIGAFQKHISNLTPLEMEGSLYDRF